MLGNRWGGTISTSVWATSFTPALRVVAQGRRGLFKLFRVGEFTFWLLIISWVIRFAGRFLWFLGIVI
jgi:hypothetical protein